MLITSAVSYFINAAIAKGRYAKSDHMNFETPLTSLVWITSILSIIATFIVSKLMIPVLGGNDSLWWKLSLIISCGTLAGAVIPELVKVFTSMKSRHVSEVVTSSREGGASLNILSGLVAGDFSAYWLGLTMVGLMALGSFFTQGLGSTMPGTNVPLMLAPAVFAFGLVAFAMVGRSVHFLGYAAMGVVVAFGALQPGRTR